MPAAAAKDGDVEADLVALGLAAVLGDDEVAALRIKAGGLVETAGRRLKDRHVA
jgi:hypothetical protein